MACHPGHFGDGDGHSRCYLESRELLRDWPEDDEVAALSWEKRLVQDSRLDMEPLGRKGAAPVTSLSQSCRCCK
jgi:hypothetical protein